MQKNLILILDSHKPLETQDGLQEKTASVSTRIVASGSLDSMGIVLCFIFVSKSFDFNTATFWPVLRAGLSQGAI